MSAPIAPRKFRNNNGNSRTDFEKREKRRTIKKLQDAITENNITEVQEMLLHEFDVDFQYRGQTCLQLAVRLGFYEICQMLILAGADVNAADAEANSLLIVACQNDHQSIAELLIQNKADTNFTNADGETAINICAAQGNVKSTELLLNKGCDVNICNYRIESPLYSACKNGHVDEVSRLVEDKDCDINWGDTNHTMPLMLACEYGSTDIAKILINANCEINRQDRSGQTALFIASTNGHCDIVSLLLAANVDTNICTTKGFTPLLGAIRNNHVDTAKLLIEGGCEVDKPDRLKLTPIHAALKQVSQYFNPGPSKPVDLVNLLIKANVKLDVVDSQGWSPLYQTAFSGEIDLCRLLLDINSPLDSVTLKDETILHGAVYGNKEEIVQVFIKAGCPVNKINKEGHHPLLTAILSRSNIEIIKVLVEAGSDLNLKEPMLNQSPLQEAICHQYTQAAILLINSGCDINVENSKHQSAIYNASEKGDNKVVELLLKQPNINLKPSNINVSSLHIACCNNHVHVVQMLLDAGYNINMINFNGLTPFQTALQEEKANVCKTLINYGCDINAHAKTTSLRKCCLVYDDAHPHFCLEPLFLALTHKDVELIQIMIQCYDHLPYKTIKLLDIILKTTTEMNVHYSASMRKQLANIFQEATRIPRSLQILCRNKIRGAIGSPLKIKVPSLPVANKLKDFILMAGLLDIKLAEEAEMKGWYK